MQHNGEVAKGMVTVGALGSGVSLFTVPLFTYGNMWSLFFFVTSMAAAMWGWWIMRQERESEKHNRMRALARDQETKEILRNMQLDNLETANMVSRMIKAIETRNKGD